MRRVLIFILLAVPLVFVACGSSANSQDQKVRNAVASYFQALQTSNGTELCGLMDPQAFKTANSGYTCEEAAQFIFALTRQAFHNPRFQTCFTNISKVIKSGTGTVTINGSKASYNLEQSKLPQACKQISSSQGGGSPSKPLSLHLVDGQWRIENISN